ncbi:penicillin-binding protein activator LpoB [candidate division KSB1 bacterium]|nr:MAG: penicillin-binding protein activator LpoB [candidate division KSB1 bacterium]
MNNQRLVFSLIFSILLTSFLIFSCSGPSRTVKRVQVDQAIDLSGHWNDTDARLTAKAMVQDVLSRPWLRNFIREHNRQPVVIVGMIRNRSSEHIETDMFIKDIERELLNSGKVKFVASDKERQSVRKERLDQQSFANPETAKELANELGADFMLQGEITSVTDSFEGRKVVKYQVNLELIDIESNTKVWIGQKEIKKFIEQKKYKW